MPSTTLKRRWTEDGMRGKVPKQRKKIKKQRHYYSSSDEEEGAADAPKDFAPVSLESDEEDLRHESRRPANSKPKPTAKVAVKKAIKDTPKEEEGAVEKESVVEPKLKDASLPPEKDVIFAEESEEDEDDQVEGEPDGSDSDASSASELSQTSTNNPRRVRKRNDPEAFATSISKILGTKLTSQKRAEPILSRSKSAQDANKTLADHKLTLKAHRSLLAEKRAAQEKGRVKDVLGLNKAEVSTAEIVAEEKRLRRTAQKGVIRLFNAVRAAQVKAELAEKEARQKGVVGMGKREEAVKEMSKQGFLEMIAGGGKKKEDSVEA
ncbi:Rrp15p-domain-containing protein [Clohesyomyces aquaticus]|uniref:Rrp15p-domain-containing protein n=1 Tax=Clohesyomyces aquaticus TaxID=1231657 RepID=A0A1Y1Y540_9PLEO|nr:Rrp15p-domain-containing protein [Clohesyomyces aquaticus]